MNLDPTTPEGLENAKRLAEEERGKEPEDVEYNMIAPGRYYLALWYADFPASWGMWKRGGNITFLVWRKFEEPDTWWIRFRFRHYKTKNSAFDGEDFFDWHTKKARNRSEQQVLADMDRMIKGLTVQFGMPTDVIWIRGDIDVFHRAALTANRPWLQVKTAPMDE